MRFLLPIIRLVYFPVALLFFGARSLAAAIPSSKKAYLEIELDGQIVESYEEKFLAPIIRRLMGRAPKRYVELSEFRELVRRLTADPKVSGVLVRIGNISGGWASVAEIREGLSAIKHKGKKEIVLHAKTHISNAGLFLMGTADRVLMTPAGMIAAKGVVARTVFLKGGLEKLGVRIDAWRQGEYKSAPERFIRKERSEADEKQTRELVETFDNAIVDSLEETTKSRDMALKWLDTLPRNAEQALEEGIIHGVCRDEELESIVVGQKEKLRLISADDYSIARRGFPMIRTPARVGIVEINGIIVDEPASSPSGGPSCVGDRAVQDLRFALRSKKIGGVVVAVNSRGGSVTASDQIWSAIRRLGQEKPVVAWFGDVAASGGYYVACGASEIIAHPLSITGSIGVFAMLPNWSELAERLDLREDIIETRRDAHIYSPWSNPSDETKRRFDEGIEAMYNQFLRIVAQARQRSPDEIHALAQGRVYSGKKAHEVGLVDKLGSLPLAEEAIRDQLGLKDLPAVTVRAKKFLPRPKPFKSETA